MSTARISCAAAAVITTDLISSTRDTITGNISRALTLAGLWITYLTIPAIAVKPLIAARNKIVVAAAVVAVIIVVSRVVIRRSGVRYRTADNRDHIGIG